jgi:hypothetical protein
MWRSQQRSPGETGVFVCPTNVSLEDFAEFAATSGNAVITVFHLFPLQLTSLKPVLPRFPQLEPSDYNQV